MQLPELSLEQIKADRELLAYQFMTSTVEQIRYAVESVDPDWGEHYAGDIDRAFDDYWDRAKEEMIRALVDSFK